MSTDSQISANLAPTSSSSSSNVSRRLSNNDSGLAPDSPVSLPLRLRSPRDKPTIEPLPNSSQARRASIEDLSDFLSKMDSSIAVNTKTSISLIKSSKIEEKEADASLNNTNSRLSEGYSTEEEMSQSFRKNFNWNVFLVAIKLLGVRATIFLNDEKYIEICFGSTNTVDQSVEYSER